MTGGAAPSPLDECECGDYRRQHVGPEQRGACGICASMGGVGTGPCSRFRLFRSSADRDTEESVRGEELADTQHALQQGRDHDLPCGCQTRSGMTLLCQEHTRAVFGTELRSV